MVVFEIATGDALVLTLALVGSLAYLAIHFLVLLPRRMDQLYQQQKLLHEPAAVEINEHAFIAKTRYTEAMLPWTLFRKWKASPEMILLYQSDAMYHILARRWFESMRDCGSDVRELMHDGCPVACVEDAPFGYVNAFTSHVNVGFFQGVDLPDPLRLLAGTGKRMRHVKLRPGIAINAEALSRLIEHAYADIKARLAAGAT